MDILLRLKQVLDANNIQLLGTIKDSPSDVMVSCPYHKNGQERRPSAGIRKSDGQFHCFACGAVHSLPEMISYCLGYTTDELGKQGWLWLTRNFLQVVIEERHDIPLDMSRTVTKQAPKYVSEEELDSYRYYHPYMYKRKMTDREIAIFDIGYDKNTQCITFPVRDESGHTLFVARRSVNTKYFNYPRDVEKPLYGLYELRQNAPNATEVIVCESMIDAITCWVYGKYGVAMNGLGTDLQFRQLMTLPCRKLILGTDNDKAGQSARQRLRQNLRGKIITEYRLPPNRKDINDLSKEEFDALEEDF